MKSKEKKIKKIGLITLFILTTILLISTYNIKTNAAYTPSWDYGEFRVIGYIVDIDEELINQSNIEYNCAKIYVKTIGCLDDDNNFISFENQPNQYIYVDLDINPNLETIKGVSLYQLFMDYSQGTPNFQALLIWKTIPVPPPSTSNYIYNWLGYNGDAWGGDWNLTGITTLNDYIQYSPTQIDNTNDINTAYQNGYNSGYINGLQQGLATDEVGTYQTLLGTILAYPYAIFTKSLNVEIFGVNIGLFIFALCLVSLAFSIFAIIRKVH